MRNTPSLLIIFMLLIGPSGNLLAWEGDAGKSPDGRPGAAREEKASARSTTGASQFDETTTQYLKKFRSINSELVAAHEELYRYNNPDRSSRGLSLEEILKQQGAASDRKMQEQMIENKKVKVEERISGLQKDAENLKADLARYHNGNVPKNVSDAWKTEQDFTEYRISKYK
ncbi:MAG: hypothetical protein PHT96_14820 [Syntrophorhabdaceae bacterium]|nr:hypothetical protein [Syntrophorhabdaceae bacterium]